MSLIAYLLTQLECDLSGPTLWRKIRKVTNIIIISAYLWILTLTEFHFKEKFQKSLQVLTVASSVLQCLLCFSGICTKIPFSTQNWNCLTSNSDFWILSLQLSWVWRALWLLLSPLISLEWLDTAFGWADQFVNKLFATWEHQKTTRLEIGLWL